MDGLRLARIGLSTISWSSAPIRSRSTQGELPVIFEAAGGLHKLVRWFFPCLVETSTQHEKNRGK
jgi:hypothetical protein